MILDIPCKIGDTVYAIRNYHSAKKIVSGKVSEMYFIDGMRLCIVVRGVCRGQWGKTVFATQEEAERSQKDYINRHGKTFGSVEN